ncbi:MAG TPA: heparinase II/III family protein, partial [Methylocystis sp.]|nr:heparinase II/III family protein [Methylocystis sp.]
LVGDGQDCGILSQRANSSIARMILCERKASPWGVEVLKGETILSRLRARLRAAARPVARRLVRAMASYHAFRALRIGAPTRLRGAPPDLRTGDVTAAEELYSGLFTFHGRTLRAGERSPFSLAAPSREWRRTLCSFAWLRDLRAAKESWARERAQGLVSAFLECDPTRDDPAQESGVIARRMLSFLAHSPMILAQAPPELHQGFMKALAKDGQRLARTVVHGRARGVERLSCALALTEFAICADLGADTRAQAATLFGEELRRQILPDGGHVDRNPQTVLDLLLDLLALRSLYASRGVIAPPALQGAIERMTRMLRMMRHGDGSLALFNGMSFTEPGDLATVFMHEAPVGAPSHAPRSGYLRLAAGDALAIIDAGPPPPKEFSRLAHAGALAFEFSIGRERVVVNCGAPARASDAGREDARASAAHAALVIGGESSSTFASLSARRGAGLILTGPQSVKAKIERRRGCEIAVLAHDGYARRFGLIHRRKLALAADGAALYGLDYLLPTKSAARAKAAPDLASHFPLHPAIEARLDESGRQVELSLPSGAKLIFAAPGLTPTLEDAVYFAAPAGARKTKQIVLRARAAAGVRLRWSFRRAGEAAQSGDGVESLDLQRE